MPERASVGSVTQLGVESPSGTIAPANRQFESFTIMVRDMPKTRDRTMQGAKHPTAVQLAQESTEANIAGWPTYVADVYLFSGLYGTPVFTTVGAASKKQTWSPQAANVDVPVTYTTQNGSAVRAHQFPFGTIIDYGWKWTRKDITLSGKMIGQLLQDGITLTASPTLVADVPIAPDDAHFFLDVSSATLGTTRLTRVFACDLALTGKYGPIWPSDRSHMDWTAVVDLPHKLEVKMLVEADASGMGILANLRQANNPTYYLRAQHQGPVMPGENIQTITITGTPTGGTFTLSYKGQTTAGIAYNAIGSVVQTALQGLSTVGTGNATVAGGAGGPYTITMAGTLVSDLTAITTSGAGLTGGVSPASNATQSPTFYLLQHDLAVKVADVAEMKDEEGVYALEYTFMAVYDPTWGHAHIVTMQNQLAAL